ncbi:hypothetical protein [Phocaeicola sp.]
MTTTLLIAALILIIGFILYKVHQQRILKRKMETKDAELRKWCILRYSNIIGGNAIVYAEKLFQQIQSSPNKETLIDIIPSFAFTTTNECAQMAHYIDTGIIPPELSQSLKQPHQSACESIDYS